MSAATTAAMTSDCGFQSAGRMSPWKAATNGLESSVPTSSTVGICDATMTTAAPVVKPVTIGCDMRYAMKPARARPRAVSYTHLRAHETDSYLVCRLLLEK